MPETPRLLLPYPPGPQANDIPTDIKRLVDRLEALEKEKIGRWHMTFAKTPSPRHLFMQGQTLQKSAYPDLFERYGITAASWVLPNLAGRTPIGTSNSNILSQFTGAVQNLIYLSIPQLPAHNHPQAAHVHDPGSGSGHQYVITSATEEQHWLTSIAQAVGGPGNTQVTYTDSPPSQPGIGNTGSGAAIDITPAGVLTNFEMQVL